jgi:hypothetical protein
MTGRRVSCNQSSAARFRAPAQTSRTLVRTAAILMALTAVIASGACGSDSPTAPTYKSTDPVVGAYVLETVQSNALPYAMFAEAGYSLEITAGSVDVRTGGEFIQAITTRETVAGHASIYVDSTRGAWSQTGSTVTFTLTGQDPHTIGYDGNRLTWMVADFETTFTYVYKRSP